jgi:RecG-like helicase
VVLPGGRRRGFGRGQPPGVAAARKPEDDYERPVPSADCQPIGSLSKPGRATVEGRVRAVEIRPAGESSVFACTVADSTGELTALFYGRQHIAGVEPGVRIRLTGAFGIRAGAPVMINPNYMLLSSA